MNIAPIIPPISPELSGISGTSGTAAEKAHKTDLGEAFSKVLADASHAEHTATQAADRFAQGDPSMGIHEVMIATEKANLAVHYVTTLKNKALEAYKELMNTQV